MSGDWKSSTIAFKFTSNFFLCSFTIFSSLTKRPKNVKSLLTSWVDFQSMFLQVFALKVEQSKRIFLPWFDADVKTDSICLIHLFKLKSITYLRCYFFSSHSRWLLISYVICNPAKMLRIRRCYSSFAQKNIVRIAYAILVMSWVSNIKNTATWLRIVYKNTPVSVFPDKTGWNLSIVCLDLWLLNFFTYLTKFIL